MLNYYYPDYYRNINTISEEQVPPCMQNSFMRTGIHVPDFWSFGPLKIEWSFSGESINLVIKMFEEAIKDMVLSLSKPTLSFTTTLGDAAINMTVNADFIKKQIAITGAACFDTVCSTFNNTIIAKW